MGDAAAISTAPAPLVGSRSAAEIFRRVSTASVPAALYLACRGLGLLVLWAMKSLRGAQIDLFAWDGVWYRFIAQSGYAGADIFGTASRKAPPFSSEAFFPAYSMLLRATGFLLPGSDYTAAVVVANLAVGVVFAYGVRRLARHITGSDRAALVAVVLVAGAPMAIVYNLAYAEVLLCALTAWALVGLVEHRWLLAGATTLLAGLSRPSSVALVVVVFAVTAWHAGRSRDFYAMCAAVLAPAGLVAYLANVAMKTGSLTGYADIQRAGWNLQVDGGVFMVKWAWITLNVEGSPYTAFVVWSLVAALAALVLTAGRLPWTAWSYAGLLVALAITTSGIVYDRPRELLPAFVLLIPAAAWLARQRPAVAVILTAGFLLFSAWLSAYSLTGWVSAI